MMKKMKITLVTNFNNYFYLIKINYYKLLLLLFILKIKTYYVIK
jgi:hypothetical protein